MNRLEFLKKTTLASISLSLLYNCDFKLKKGTVIGCLGDSITFAGKNGYVELLQNFFDTKYPELKLTFVNLGVSGETITGLTEDSHPTPRPYLFNRLQKVLQETKADIYTFCYGVNCGIYQPLNDEKLALYEKGVSHFLDSLSEFNAKAILLTPPPLAFSQKNNKPPYTWQKPYPNYNDEVILAFKKVIEDIQHANTILKVDIHTALWNKKEEAYDKDPIHPNPVGQKIIADMLKNTFNS